MKKKTGITAWVAALALALAAVAAATPPVGVTAQSEECFNPTGGTIPLTCDVQCVSSQPCEDYHVSLCANAQVDEGIAGSANSLPGGTFAKTTCTEPSAPFGGSFTATGTWSGTNSVFFVCLPSSLTGSGATFLVAASDKTGEAATTTVTVPVCTASGPVLTISKQLWNTQPVNGHFRQNDEIEFQIIVKNTGSAPTKTGAVVNMTDVLPAPLAFDHAVPPLTNDDDCTSTGNTLSCNVENNVLEPGGTWVYYVFCKATRPGVFDNTASVAGGGASPATSNTVVIDVLGPRPPLARKGQQPLRDLSGRPSGNP